MENIYPFEVTVLVLTYNPDRDKLVKTLRSILLQQGVRIQIVVADDGSKNNLFDEIVSLFDEYAFRDYVLVANEYNQGTTCNFYSGLKRAEGKYLKGISPGDYLYKEDVLYQWVRFMDNGEYECSFGNAIYYHYRYGLLSPIKRPYGFPRLPKLYYADAYRTEDVKINCYVLRDFILGASYFCKTELINKYILPLIGKVKYLEDALYRLMLLDDIKTVYYDCPVIIYEYGTGVSTTSNPVWVEMLREDQKAINNIVSELKNSDDFVDKYKKYLLQPSQTGLFKRYIVILRFFPKGIMWGIYRKLLIRFGKCQTETTIDQEFVRKIGEQCASD